MRIAVIVIGLVLFLLWIPLSCLGVVASVATEAYHPVLPFIIPFLFAVGAGFVIRFPLVSVVIYLITTALAITLISPAIEDPGDSNLLIAIALLVVPQFSLAIMSYFGYLELKRQNNTY